jgi:hypothetical protein
LNRQAAKTAKKPEQESEEAATRGTRHSSSIAKTGIEENGNEQEAPAAA